MNRKKPQREKAALIESQAQAIKDILKTISIRKARFMAKQLVQGEPK